MAFFAGYGFNKSHSAAYALVAYHTAWLKAHYPVHFMAALLTNEKGNTDKLVKYINESREMRSRFSRPTSTPPVWTSRWKASGFASVCRRSRMSARGRSGRSSRPVDLRELSLAARLCSRGRPRPVNKRVLEALVQSGALDSLGARRSQLAAAIDAAMEFGQRQRADRETGQGNLFGGPRARLGAAPAQALPDLPEWDERTRLAHEKATLGFYVTGHPLESQRELLGEFATHTSLSLREAISGTEVAVGGIISDLRRRKSRKGAWWASMQLEDLEGQIDVLVFPKTYATCQEMLADERAAMVFGRLEADEDRVRVIADEVCPLEIAA